jgi:hypothetical protein
MAEDYTPTEIEKKAISLVKNEKTKWEEASMNVRDLIKKVRKNYVNRFDGSQITAYTEREKVFVPLTLYHTRTVAAKFNVEEDAIHINPGSDEELDRAFLLQEVIKDQMRDKNMADVFDEVKERMVLEGTAVTEQGWEFRKTYELFSNEEPLPNDKITKKIKKKLKRGVNLINKRLKLIQKTEDYISYVPVNVLDIFCDPTIRSLQESTYIARKVYPLEELKRNVVFKNTKYVKGRTSIDSDNYDSTSTTEHDLAGQSEIRHEQPVAEVYERWGKIPLSWVNGNEEDGEKMIEGVIDIADLNGKPVVTRIRENPRDDKRHPHLELKYEVVPGRWYGRGVGESLIHIQSYLNEIVNRRIDNEHVLHQGLFLRRKGSGVKKVIAAAGQFIDVTSLTDVSQLQTVDITQGTYIGEKNAYQLAEKVTGAYDMQASGQSRARSAAEAIIQEREAGMRFKEVANRLKQYVRKLVKDHFVPLNLQYNEKSITLRLTGTSQELGKVDKLLEIPAEEQMEGNRFIDIPSVNRDLSPVSEKGYDIDVDIDSSLPMDRASRIQYLKDSIAMASQDQRSGMNIRELYKELFKTLGFTSERFYVPPEEEAMQQEQMAQEEEVQAGIESAPKEEVIPGADMNPEAGAILPERAEAQAAGQQKSYQERIEQQAQI